MSYCLIIAVFILSGNESQISFRRTKGFKIAAVILHCIGDDIAPQGGIDGHFNIRQRHGLMRHHQQSNSISQELFDGILPVFIIGCSFFIFPYFGHFEKNADNILDLPASGAGGPFHFIIKKRKRVFAQSDQIITAAGFAGVSLPCFTFIRFCTKHNTAEFQFQKAQGDAAKGSRTFAASCHSEADQSRTGVPDRPRITVEVQNFMVENRHIIPILSI